MSKRYTEEQKEEAVKMVLAGQQHRYVGKLLGIPASTVSTWMAEYRSGQLLRSGYKQAEVKHIHTLITEISNIKEDMLTIAATLDEHIQYLHHWEAIEAALIEASNLKIRLDTAIREKKAYEARLVERAMAVHSSD